MSWRSRSQRKDPKAYSTQVLEHMIQECDDIIRREGHTLEQYTAIIPRMIPIEAAIRTQATAIADLEHDRLNSIGRVFHPNEARTYDARLKTLNDQLQCLYAEMRAASSGSPCVSVDQAIREKEAAEYRLESKRKWRDHLMGILLEKKRVRAIREAKEAKVAAFDGKTRERAAVVKKQLELYPYCPYCGNAIGEVPHADHIYPAVLGGLSTRENMVHICESCNLKKGTKTLREFIETYQLDRTRVEAVLQRLNKKF